MPTTLPTGCVLRWRGELVPAPTRSASATGTNVQHFQRLGRHWRFSVSLHAMTQADSMDWVDLEDETDTLVWAIDQGDLVADNEGAPRVNGAGQTGSSLDIDGVTTGFVLPKGAYISVITNGRRYVYRNKTNTVFTTGSASVDVMPPLRVSPGNNDVVELSDPKVEGLVSFAGFDHARRRDNVVSGVQFEIEERG